MTEEKRRHCSGGRHSDFGYGYGLGKLQFQRVKAKVAKMVVCMEVRSEQKVVWWTQWVARSCKKRCHSCFVNWDEGILSGVCGGQSSMLFDGFGWRTRWVFTCSWKSVGGLWWMFFGGKLRVGTTKPRHEGKKKEKFFLENL